MKKKLLFLGALMLTSVGAFAQAIVTWEQPTLEGVKSTALSVGDTVYLYNKEAGGFLRGLGEGAAPHWGSRAGVSLLGADKVIIQKPFAENVKEETEETNSVNDYPYWMTESTWDGTSYIIQNYASHITKPRIDEVWFGLMDYGTIWTDRQNNHGANENFFWDITPNDNGTYTIAASNKVPWLANKDLWETLIIMGSDGTDSIRPVIEPGKTYRLGVNLDDVDHVLNFEGLTVGEDKVPANLSYEWTFVSQNDYNALVPVIEELTAENERYNAAIALKAYIEAKTTEFADANLDFSAAWAVYNNLESTTEELVAGKELVNQVIVAYQESQATPNNPSDMTSKIPNADFEGGATTSWSYTKNGGNGPAYDAGFADPDNTGKGFEFWNATVTSLSFDIYQKISGLPSGVYALSADITNSLNGQGQLNNGGRVYVYSTVTPLDAEAQTSYSAPVRIQSEDAVVRGDTYTAWFPVFASSDTVQVGAKTVGTMDARWVVGDSFKLLYYGNSPAAYDLWKEQVLAIYPSIDEIIPDEETLHTASYATAYVDALAAAKEESDPAKMTATIGAVQPALDSLRANIAAYIAYIAKADAVQEELANTELYGDAAGYLSDYFISGDEPGDYPHGGYEYIINECPLTTAELNAEINNLTLWLEEAIRTSMTEGSDVTNMLVNASFADGFNGWTNNSQGDNPKGYRSASNGLPAVVENYQCSKVEIYQEIKDVPAGIYSISAQAFERPDWNENLTGEEQTKVCIFMNGFQTPIKSITADALPADEAEDGVNFKQSNAYDFNGSWIPNGMEDASYAFGASSASYPAGTRYLNKCYGIVGDDGVMKIGLTSNGQHVQWCLWANFRLTFEGKNEEAIQSILASTIETANNFMEERGGEMTEPAINALGDAIAQGEDAEGADYETSLAALNALNAATAAANANIKAYADFSAAYDAMDVAISEYEETASQEALDKYAEVSEKTEAPEALTTEELIALTEDINKVVAMLKDEYNFANATAPEIPENAVYPYDLTSVIVNPSFDGNRDGWTIYEEGIQNKGALGDGYEFWNGNASTMQFDLNQTLYKLPAGKYALTADLANSLNGQSAAGDGCSYLYATVYNGDEVKEYSVAVEPKEENADVRDSYEVIFEMPEPSAKSKVVLGYKTVGVQAARWFSYDNFGLKYYAGNDPVNIEGVESAEEVVPVAIYSISGARLAAPQKGINIIKMSNGTVKKVLVK